MSVADRLARAGLFVLAASIGIGCSGGGRIYADNQDTAAEAPDVGAGNVDDDEASPRAVRPGIDVSACIPMGDPKEPYDKQAFLKNAHKTILDTYKWFLEDAKVLDHNMGLHCDNLADAALRQQVLDSFDAAMATWQVAEVMKAGPIRSRGDGEGLRDQIYSWYFLRDACTVDHGVASGSVIDYPAFKGLDALEYLLYHEGASVCGDPVLAPESTALPTPTAEEKCAYQKKVTEALVHDANNVISAWDEFRNTFLTATFKQGEVRPLTGEEMVYHALAVYLGTSVIQLKLARPFGDSLWTYGIESDELLSIPSANRCGIKTCCPEEVEAPFRRNSADLILSNVTGFDLLFFGILPTASGGSCAVGQGFRDLIYGCGTATDTGRSGPEIADHVANAANKLKNGLNDVKDGDLAALVTAHRDSGERCDKVYKNSDPTVQAVVGPLWEIVAVFRDEIGSTCDYYYGPKERVGCRPDMVIPRDIGGSDDG